MDPASYEAMQNLGSCIEASGDLNSALAKYQAALALKPSNDGAYYNLAYMLEKLNLPADAGLMYQRFHELAGKYPYDPKHIVALQQEDARAIFALPPRPIFSTKLGFPSKCFTSSRHDIFTPK